MIRPRTSYKLVLGRKIKQMINVSKDKFQTEIGASDNQIERI